MPQTTVNPTSKPTHPTDGPTQSKPTTKYPTEHPPTTKWPTEPPTQTTEHSQPTNGASTTAVPSKPGKSLGGGAVAGIVLAVLVLGGLLTAGLVLLRNRDWDVTRLLPTRPTTNSAAGSAFTNISYNSGSESVQTS